MGKLLVLYRPTDGAAMSQRICDRLAGQFGQGQVLKGVGAPSAGVSPTQHVDELMGKCSAQVVVIGRQWLDLADEQGQRLLDDPNDIVRLGIESALRRGMPIIPVLVDGAPMPSTVLLPESIQRLTRRAGIPVHYDPDFEVDVNRVIHAVRQWVSSAPGQRLQGVSAKGGVVALSILSMLVWIVSLVAAIVGLANNNDTLAAYGGIGLLVDFLLSFVPWIMAMVRTAKRARWGWFVGLLLAGLYTMFFFGPLFMTLIYGIWGPDRKKL